MIRRLVVTGDMKTVNSDVFDDVVEAGVRRFQDRHGLEADGIAGRATLRAMNVTAGQRVRQLEVNLERARWVLDDIVDDFVLVNIAGFRAYVWKNREIVWETRVQVGGLWLKADVISVEPIPDDNPLLKAKNCTITPHIAWATLEARRRMVETTVQNVASFIAGRPSNLVN